MEQRKYADKIKVDYGMGFNYLENCKRTLEKSLSNLYSKMNQPGMFCQLKLKDSDFNRPKIKGEVFTNLQLHDMSE